MLNNGRAFVSASAKKHHSVVLEDIIKRIALYDFGFGRSSGCAFWVEQCTINLHSSGIYHWAKNSLRGPGRVLMLRYQVRINAVHYHRLQGINIYQWNV